MPHDLTKQPPERRRGRPALLIPVLVALGLVGGVAIGAVTITYLTSSTVTVDTIAAPVVYQAGTEISNRYVASWSLSNNQTYFSYALSAIPEANLSIDHVFKIKNQDSAARSVTLALTGGVIANAQITKFQLVFYDAADDSFVAKWDMKASASQNFASMAAGKTFYAKTFVHLASGAGDDNVSETLALSLTVA